MRPVLVCVQAELIKLRTGIIRIQWAINSLVSRERELKTYAVEKLLECTDSSSSLYVWVGCVGIIRCRIAR